MLEPRIKQLFYFLVEGLIFILMYCMFRYSYNKIFWGARHFSENPQKCWRWLATFFKNTGGERVKGIVHAKMNILSLITLKQKRQQRKQKQCFSSQFLLFCVSVQHAFTTVTWRVCALLCLETRRSTSGFTGRTPAPASAAPHACVVLSWTRVVDWQGREQFVD